MLLFIAVSGMIQQCGLTSEQVNSQDHCLSEVCMEAGDKGLAENICQELRNESPQGM